jgi:hypothetical protein
MQTAAPFSTAHVLSALGGAVAAALPRQLIDTAHADHGAIIARDTGLADASHGASAPFIVGCAQLAFAGAPPEGHSIEALLQRATLAADFILRDQRPSGLIDLLSTNYDSSPDTGFAVQALCTVIELARSRAGDPAWARLLERIELFVRRAVAGMTNDGGFHTPNHRWVIASALAQAGALFPDLHVAPTIDLYLGEGIDIDPEGAYIERSIGVYDAVTNRSLLLLADNYAAEHVRAAVRANLRLDLHLLHADGAAETGLSRRQDYGTRVVPLGLAACYLQCGMHDGDAQFVAAARALWDRAGQAHLGELIWLAYLLLRDGEPHMAPAELPADYVRFFPHNGIWRLRRGKLSVSLFRGVSRLLTMCYGSAELSSLKISQTYFGVGRFVAETMEERAGGVMLHSSGRSNPRRPAYELPLGRPVAPEEWEARMEERRLRAVPPCESELALSEAPGGIDLRYRTLDGLDRVTAQIALDFPPGGVWETDDACFAPRAGQVIFLRRGFGVMRYGDEAIRIGPGADAHRTWQMRHAEEAPDHVRVLLTFRTPIDHTLQLRAGAW